MNRALLKRAALRIIPSLIALAIFFFGVVYVLGLQRQDDCRDTNVLRGVVGDVIGTVESRVRATAEKAPPGSPERREGVRGADEYKGYLDRLREVVQTTDVFADDGTLNAGESVQVDCGSYFP